jgi:hypothetical protein
MTWFEIEFDNTSINSEISIIYDFVVDKLDTGATELPQNKK